MLQSLKEITLFCVKEITFSCVRDNALLCERDNALVCERGDALRERDNARVKECRVLCPSVDTKGGPLQQGT